jgi:hypothetical protein
MKNMHDEKFAEAISNRLREIDEAPDELVWKNLNTRLKKDRHKKFWKNLAMGGSFLIGLVVIIVAIEESNLNLGEIEYKDATSKPKGSEKKAQSTEPPNLQNSSQSGNVEEGPDLSKVETQGVYSGKASNEDTNKNKFAPDFFRSNALPDFSIRKKNFQAEIRPHYIPAPVENTLAIGKETKKRQNFLKGMTGYFQATAFTNYIIIDPLRNDDVVITRIESMGIFSHKRLGYGVEAGLTRIINDRWSIAAGFSYYQQNMDVRYFYRIEGQFQVNRTSENEIELIPMTVEESKVIDHSMKNIGLDLNAFYSVRRQRLEQKAGFGLSYQHGLYSSHNVSYDNSDSWYVNYNFLYRVEYGLSERITLYFQPRYSRPLLIDENLNEPLKLKTTRVGVSLGVTLGF